jgi:hypothetical protein
MFCEINSKKKLAAGLSDGLALKMSHRSVKSYVQIQGILFEKEGLLSS